MDAIIETVKDSCQMVLVSDNHEALAEVERQIIKLQEEVLDFHRARQGYAVTEAEYNAQIEAFKSVCHTSFGLILFSLL